MAVGHRRGGACYPVHQRTRARSETAQRCGGRSATSCQSRRGCRDGLTRCQCLRPSPKRHAQLRPARRLHLTRRGRSRAWHPAPRRGLESGHAPACARATMPSSVSGDGGRGVQSERGVGGKSCQLRARRRVGDRGGFCAATGRLGCGRQVGESYPSRWLRCWA